MWRRHILSPCNALSLPPALPCARAVIQHCTPPPVVGILPALTVYRHRHTHRHTHVHETGWREAAWVEWGHRERCLGLALLPGSWDADSKRQWEKAWGWTREGRESRWQENPELSKRKRSQELVVRKGTACGVMTGERQPKESMGQRMLEEVSGWRSGWGGMEGTTPSAWLGEHLRG